MSLALAKDPALQPLGQGRAEGKSAHLREGKIEGVHPGKYEGENNGNQEGNHEGNHEGNREGNREGSLIEVSPYADSAHLLDLSSVSRSQQLLAKALRILRYIKEDYATAPYAKSFNWHEIVLDLQSLSRQEGHQWQQQHFYIVVFRSLLPPSTDRQELGSLDQIAHAEATRSGGLLKYWFGVPDKHGRNLATCIWRSKSDIGPASVGPGHKEAMRKTRAMYVEWRVERLRFVIDKHAAGWRIEEWKD